MPLLSDADNASLIALDPTVATYTVGEGGTIDGIFSEPYTALSFLDGIPVGSASPTLLTRTIDVEDSGLDEQDTLTIAGTNYVIFEIQKQDGDGAMTSLVLRR